MLVVASGLVFAYSLQPGKDGCGSGYLLFKEMLEMPGFVYDLSRVRARGLPIDKLFCALCAHHPPAEPSGCGAPRGSGIKPSGGGPSSWAWGALLTSKSPPPPLLPPPLLLLRGLVTGSFWGVAFRSLYGSFVRIFDALTLILGALRACSARCARSRCNLSASASLSGSNICPLVSLHVVCGAARPRGSGQECMQEML